MPPVIDSLWVYLSATPLLWLTVTLLCYAAAHAIYERANDNPFLNPVALAVAVVVAILLATDTPYGAYFDGAQFVHFLLGPATVALAVPFYGNLRAVRRAALPMAVALVVGSIVAVVSAVAVAALLGADRETLLSIAPKSVTTPIAMGIAEKIGGLPSLTAVMVILTGILGAVLVTPLMNLLRFRRWEARGFAVGIAAHGIGTARAFQINERAGTFAGIAMALNAVITALLVPLLLTLL